MNKILVLFDSATGHTRRMAELVAEGAQSIAETDVRLRSVEDATAADVLALIAKVTDAAQRERGIALETEVQSLRIWEIADVTDANTHTAMTNFKALPDDISLP